MTYPSSARRSLFTRSLFLGAALAPLAFAFVACSADGASDPITATGNTDPQPTASLPPSTVPEGGNTVPDSGGGKDGGKDAAKDATAETGVDAGKPAPNPGDACKALDEIFPRTCGACGKQEAICLAKPDGTPGVVSDYSPCVGELVDGCIPGTVENEACGNCGTRKRTCNAYCAWITAACAGEPVDSCTPTAVDYTSAGCGVGTVRTRTCNAACSWSGFGLSCSALDLKLVVAGTAGDSVSGIYPLRATKADKRLTGTCPNGSFSTTTNHPYVYVELVNPTEQTLTLSAWNTIAKTGGTIIDTLMTWYDSDSPPTDEPGRKACAKGTIDSCPSGLPCGDTKWAGLTGTSAVTIPPFGSVTLMFQSYYAAGGSSPSEGEVKLVVRTDTAL